MARTRRTLLVLIQGAVAGTLSEDDHGSLAFAYDRAYAGPPLSLSMPLGEGPFKDRTVRPYLFGLLPDDRRTRLAMGRAHGVDRDNPFRLLEVMGWDCPGAVQFCAEGQLGELEGRELNYVPIDEGDIGDDLSRVTSRSDASWSREPERWSLGGMQGKVALAHLDGRWWRCEGSAATTHIIKPGVPGLPLQALNEAVCQRLAALCGLPASPVEYERFGDVDAVVVRRYDRMVDGMAVTRLHQEDLCQSLGVMPDGKYAEDGGPAAIDILHVLAANDNAEENRLAFTAELFFNYLVGGNDAHAKNYSVILDGDGPVMAPIYDCASGTPYGTSELDSRSAAMRIGGEGRYLRVKRRHVERYAERAGMDPDLCIGLMERLARSILEHLDSAFEQFRGEDAELTRDVDSLASHLRDPVVRICESVLPKS